MKDMKFRHEYKQIINFYDSIALSNRLKYIIPYDKNTDSYGKYKVKSLYFDNVYDKALIEKSIGISKREKFRIRYYNDNLNFIKLEKKSKIKDLCNKKSEKISVDQCRKILNGDYNWMTYSKKALFIEFYSKLLENALRPKVIVEYTREPFTYPAGNVRVTIDSSIRTAGFSTNFLDAKNITFSATSPGMAVLEVKFDEFLPSFIKDAITLNNNSHISFSKYASCRII